MRHASVIATYTGVLVAALTVSKRRQQMQASDVILAALATHKASRLISRSRVMRFVREPFTEVQGKGLPSELDERPKQESEAQKTVGELLTCPYCLDVWVATLLQAAWGVNPRVTRHVINTFAIVAISDFLQAAYVKTLSE